MLEPRYFAHCMDDYKECGWGIFERFGIGSGHGSKVLVPAGLIVRLSPYASSVNDNITSPFGCPWVKRQDRCPEASGGGN
ncbi:MAG: hypothetical protein GMKNLPBB_03385 [Myxococcota bacterium]|nr:hypothetical protein [Myxococcota bacterium]